MRGIVAGDVFRRLVATQSHVEWTPVGNRVLLFVRMFYGDPSSQRWEDAGGFTRQPGNSKRAHLSVPALQTPPKFHEKTHRERRKIEISSGRGNKKREIMGPPPFGPPPLRTRHGRLWPNRLWPKVVSQWYGRLWPQPTSTLAITDFGQYRLWPIPTLAKPTLAKSSLICCVVCCVVLCCVLSVCHGYLFHGISGVSCGFGLDRPSWDRTSLGPPFPWTALPLDLPKFRSFFSFSRRKIRSFLPSLRVFSLNYGGVVQGQGPQNVHVWALWLCERNPGGFGASHDNQRTPNVHI